MGLIRTNKWPGINKLPQITCDFFLYLWCERSQFNANHCIYNIINLQISIIRPHFILVVYHTEFQFNFHPSSVVNVYIFIIFYVYMTQQIMLK